MITLKNNALTNYHLILAFLLLSLSQFGQRSSIGQPEINLLGRTDSIGYSEGAVKIRDSLFIEVFYQYGDTAKIQMHFLDLAILDRAAARKKKILHLDTDTLIIRARYRFGVFGFFTDKDAEITRGKVYGRVEVVELSTKTATLKLDVYAFDRSGTEKRKFVGTRTYRKRRLWRK